MSDEGKLDLNRRTFIGAIAVAGAGAVLASCSKSYPTLTFVDVAPDGPPLKAGLIGCGDGARSTRRFVPLRRRRPALRGARPYPARRMAAH